MPRFSRKVCVPAPDARLEGGPVRFITWLSYFAMCLGMFMAILDMQIVASSLPDIQAGLNIPFDALSWIQTAYLIAEIIAMPMTGWLTSLLSLRVLFLIAITTFTIASSGCAASTSFAMLISFRIVQGFSAGILIPVTFTAIFSLFPVRLHPRATAIGGLFAMVAPMLGPTLGGYITDSFSWPWLFLINVGPGIIAATIAVVTLRTDKAEPSAWKRFDVWSFVAFSVSLATFEIGLKEAATRSWADPYTLTSFVVCIVGGAVGIRRCLARTRPLVDLRLLFEPGFAVSCFYSFVLGGGLFGSVYLLPLFLGYVRDHTAFEIGSIMIVAGASQFFALPIAVLLVKRVDLRLLTGVGYALFAVGLLANGFATRDTDFAGLFWPQVIRGIAVMLCLMPTTSVALEGKPRQDVANASGLFNLMRNLGGAVWIALIDTILQLRTPVHLTALAQRLQAGDRDAASFVGLPLARFHGVPIGPVDEGTKQMVLPLLKRAASVMAFNEAWLILGAFTALSLFALPLLRRAIHALASDGPATPFH